MALNTPLFELHQSLGGRMVDFAGWQMPVQYKSIVEEHLAVRASVGAFDISHMGRFSLYGPGAQAHLAHFVTCSVATMIQGQVKYGLILNEQGGTCDDVLVYHLGDHWALVVNASNRQKIWTLILASLPETEVRLVDETLETAMVAIQGPNAIALCQDIANTNFSNMGNYSAQNLTYRGCEILVSRTGYTGEDGMEWSVPSYLVDRLAKDLETHRVPWCGLGCRDTLRLEAGMPLYGHELDEAIDPLQAGLGFAVRKPLEGFVGAGALASRMMNQSRRIRKGLMLSGKRISRQGDKIYQGDREIGVVTSGTFGPTVSASIAMALIDPAFSQCLEPLEIDVRGKRERATVTPLPFYKRSKG